MRDVCFVDRFHGWAVDRLGGIAATGDGGATWTVQRSGIGQMDWWYYGGSLLCGIAFADLTHGWAVGDNGAVVATTNGGRPTDSAPPATTASGAANGGWYNHDVTVSFAATDNVGGWGVAYTECRVDDEPWTRGTQITLDAEEVGEGLHTILYRSVDKDWQSEATRTLKVGIDTQRPTTRTPYGYTVVCYRTATLKYMVVDIRPGSPTATVTVKIKNSANKVVKTMGPYSGKAVNKLLPVSFTCKLARGTYRYFVYATDKAGNAQTLPVGSNRLTVN